MKPITPQELSPNMSYVRYNGMILKVASVEHPQPLKDKRFSDKWIITLFCDGFITCTINEIKPVELTEEILLRLGFEETKHGFYKWPIEVRARGYLVTMLGHKSSLRNIGLNTKHLHQLQNLYKSLTEEELELKPKE